jgi:low affinity Fe/Cu permease
MSTLESEVLFWLSAFATLMMLCSAVVIYADFCSLILDKPDDKRVKRWSLLRSGWFFYANTAISLSTVFAMFLFQ